MLKNILQRKNLKISFTFFVILLLLFTPLAPIVVETQQANPQDEKVKKYLLNGESVVSKQELSFGKKPNEVNLTLYTLSSGKYIIYSKRHDMIVLGNEWMGLPDGEKLALQLLSLYAYEKYKPLDSFQLSSYNELSNYWNKGSEIARNYFVLSSIKVALLKLAGGTALLLISGVASGGVSLLFFVAGYSAELAYSLLEDLPKNLQINEENAPSLFLVLSLMPSNETGYKNFQKSLSKLKDVGFSKMLLNISKGIKAINLAMDLSGFSLMMLYTFAAKNPDLLLKLESLLGKETIEKAGALYIFGGNERSFEEFLEAVTNCWNKVPGSASKLNDIIVTKAVGTLKNMALGEVVSLAIDYIIHASKDVDSLMGFHGAHSILIRDLSLDLANNLGRLQDLEVLPTLDNVLSFFYHDYLLSVLLSEYYEGISKLSPDTLYKAPDDLIKFWGFEPKTSLSKGTTAETWARNILRKFSVYRSTVDQIANNKLSEAISYSVTVYKMFDEYKQDMARRRSIPSPITGTNLFIVMDVSGSMGNVFGGAKKIDAAKKAAVDLVSLTSEQDSIGLVKFSDAAELVSDLTTNKKLLVDEINKMQPESTTALGDGIWLAIERLEASLSSKKPCAVIVLTDGRNNAGIHSPREAALKAKSLNIPIYTLGFGEKGDIDENILLEIAQVTNAQYYYAPSPEDLRKIYISLSQQVSGSLVERALVQTIKKGEEHVVPTTVAPGTPYLSVKASYGGSKISMVLQRPDGLNITGTEGNVAYKEGSGFVSYVVYNPDPGEWKIKVIGTETPSEGEEYRLVVSKPGLIIEPREINVSLKPGELTKVKVKVRALRQISSIEVLKLGSFDFLNIEQSSFSNLKANEDVYFDVTLKAPDLSKGFFFKGLLGIRAVDSLIFLTINIRIVKFLIPTVLTNTSTLYEGDSLSLTVRVADDGGNPITGASIKATFGNITKNLTEVGDGFYNINFTNLSLGRKTITIIASKTEYASAITNLSIIVTMLGDINKDGLVDYKDLALLIKSYDLPIIRPEAVASGDLNKDWKVDYKDLAILLRNYGKKVP
ncbi:MAG: VWA domain-containing protein [Thermoproteota archaeon]